FFILNTFFFYNYAYHRTLHSFPTRRSSDLILIPPIENSSTSGGNGRVLGDWPRSTIFPPGSGAEMLRSAEMRMTNLSSEIGGRRSEEHTSELQSLRHLVCRLLLEKKKKLK